eukprot:TRINITY_DN19627_c0_g1_i1.p1 TRINITY_DN19627_c0_g1~~TRINITY_DN19627_c0_g1_i1.p1  ORF type:complete len:942 (-),score=248.89 TRINITY_DN19627_c0_g1_i1:42-2687(-)
MAIQKVSPVFVQCRAGDVFGFNLVNEVSTEKFITEISSILKELTHEIEDESEDLSKSEDQGSSRRTSFLSPKPVDHIVSSSSPIDESAEDNELEAKRQKTRDRAAREIYESESTYFKSLDHFLKVWMQPMKEKKLITDQDYKELFSNLEIILDFTKRLLEQLQPRIENWTKDKKIADIFISLHPYFRLYKTYCDNYDLSLETLEKLSKKKAFKQFLKQSEAKSNGFSITFYLIMPVQRVPRYNLLLRELIGNTDKNHPDLADLHKAMEYISTIAGDINQSVQKAEKARAIADLMKKNLQGLETLITPHRHLIVDGALSGSFNSIECSWVLVFNDIVAFAAHDKKEAKSKNPKRNIQGWIDFNVCWAKEQEDVLELKTPENTVLLRIKSDTKEKKDEKTKFNTIDWTEQILSGIKSWLTTPALSKDADEITINKDLFSKDSKDMYCEYRFTFYKFKDGSSYKGHWLNAKFHGIGKFVSPNGSTFEGTFQNGHIHGFATASWVNGDKYVGNWERDKPNGEGTLTTKTGTYTGQWVAGRRKGKGKLECASGDSYEGDFDGDKFHGHGIFKSTAFNFTYEGEFVDNMRQGQGVLIRNGYTYSGLWESNLPHGIGKETVESQGTYEGTFFKGRKEGEGVYTSSDGNVIYKGEWRNNLYHGLGKLTMNSSSYFYEGQFVDGRKEGQGKEMVNNQVVYEGEWENNLYEGKGVWTGLNEKYIGTFHKGLRYGNGTYTSNLFTYNGNWYRGRKEGHGMMIIDNGASYDGYWIDDLPNGEGKFEYTPEVIYSGECLNGKRQGKGTFSTLDFCFVGNWVEGKKNGSGTLTNVLTASIFEGEWSNDLKNGQGMLNSHEGESKSKWENGKQTKPGIKYNAPELPEFPSIETIFF